MRSERYKAMSMKLCPSVCSRKLPVRWRLKKIGQVKEKKQSKESWHCNCSPEDRSRPCSPQVRIVQHNALNDVWCHSIFS